MNIRKITFSQITSVLFIVFIGIYLYSRRVKSWVIMGFMLLGFFKPDIPKAGKLMEPEPQMQVRNIEGKTIDLQQQKGKVVFINFWATWCPPCLAEMPGINKLYQKLRNNPNGVFLMVDVDDNVPKSAEFAQKKGYDFPVYGGDENHVPNKLFGDGIPTTLVIDKKGNVVFRHFNRANYDDDQFTRFMLDLSKQ